ncbi:MAG TPA: hypothetical protein DEA96_19245 [Leptospiraceae bacterium]|nr:hypothetical protein [Leptospiraceae bacterium]|tara:strand:- start:29209 stop:30366 length:1158 start_codon:yes stop_codon:yes gene_type:complete
MAELKKFLKDPVFYIPALFLVALELLLQSPLYRKILEPNSYAENVNRITEIMKTSRVEPNVLILGTSVAYQGVNMPLLNKLLEKDGIVVQNGASQGAMLETQHSIYRDIKDDLPNIKAVVHVAEIYFPWQARYKLEQANQIMLAQFPRRQVLPLLGEYKFDLSVSDYAFFLFRTLTYKQDLRDLTLSPLDRVKDLGRKWRSASTDYSHINEYEYSLAAYGETREECLENAYRHAKAGTLPLKEGKPISDRHHRQAAIDTCSLASRIPVDDPGAPEWTRLFFSRLSLMHGEMKQDNVKVITLFAPYSDMMPVRDNPDPMDLWVSQLQKIHENRANIVDMRDALDGPENASYFYDILHLNKYGSREFTYLLAERLRELKPVILSQQN